MLRLLVLFVLVGSTLVTASQYGYNAQVVGSFSVSGNSQLAGSLTVSGKTSISSDFQIGDLEYSFPSAPPASGDVLFAASASNLSWESISLNSAGSSVSLVNTSATPSFKLNGLKQGDGIFITGPTNGDITIASSLSSAGGTLSLIKTLSTSTLFGLSAGTGISLSQGTNDITIATTFNPLTMWPIGAIYTSTTNTNPGTFLGGTWVAFAQGKTLFGADGSTFTGGTAGGSASATLTTSNLPSHTHGGSIPDHTHSASASGTGAGTLFRSSSGTSGSLTTGLVTQVSGALPNFTTSSCNGCSGTSFSILPPYVVVYYFQRTA